ncbi:MAG TPA: universal stress protein [Candidatus Koribacter sp.]|jgi:nucleotide-binding universal stress UspA family protein
MPLQTALHVHPKSILIATDLAPESRNAMRHALALARHFGAKLHIAHVVSSMGFTLAGPDVLAAAHDVACRDLAEYEMHLNALGALSGIRCDVAVRDGEIWPQLQQLIAEDDVELVVIGTHGRRGLGRLLLGSVAETIIRCAPCPVVTVGPSFEESGVENVRQPRPVIFAANFEPASIEALPYLVNFAVERKCPLVLLHVIQHFPEPERGKWDSVDATLDRHRDALASAERKLEGLMRSHARFCPTFDCRVMWGKPADEILMLASELRADAIAMGLHRSTHPEAITHFRSTIAYEVVCHAPCAVFTARA